MQIIELDSFDTAFPVRPGSEGAVKRRFMTLFVAEDDQAQVGGLSYVCKARSFTGEQFALKRLLAANAVPAGANVSEADRARLTQGHADAFYEEYRNQLLVSRMRGFPQLFGYGMVGDDPVIVMEWVEGASLRQFAEEARANGTPLSVLAIAQIGCAVLDVLESAARLDATLVHRDLSPANIMVRTSDATIDAQARRGRYDVCLIDFGSATAHEARAGADASFTMAAQVWRNGTPEYAAPEMLTRDLPRIDELRKSQAIDVFALCSVLYELYAGHTPWRVGDHPEISPYRLKMENAPEVPALRVPEDAALVNALMRGLATSQDERPSVHDLRVVLERFAEANGGVPHDQAGGGEAAAGASGRDGEGAARAGLLASALPAGLYTPDSMHLSMASADEGGKRAGEDVPAFSRTQTRAISRRSFLAGGLAVAAIAVAGGIMAARSCTPKAAFDFSNYPVAEAAYAGEPYYPVMERTTSSWNLRHPATGAMVALQTGGREPGRLVGGVMRLYDAASGGYGFATLAEDAKSVAWVALPRWPRAGDFCEAGDFDDGETRAAPVLDAETGRWGFIDLRGEWLVKPQFAEACGFSQGIAAVRPEGETLWAAVDCEGRRLFAPTFDVLGRFSEEGLAAARAEDGRWGLVNTDGEWAAEPRFEQLRRIEGGLAPCLLDADAGLWGYVDGEGEAAVDARFADAYPFAGAYAPAQDAETQMWGLIDRQGAWQVKPSFLSLGEKMGKLIPAHGSPAKVYDSESAEWYDYLAKNTDDYWACGYIGEAGEWAINPNFGDTLLRAPAL